MGAGGLAVFAAFGGRSRSLMVVARSLFGCCCMVFGACHFAYSEITAGMVPFPPLLFWACATGTGHILAGVALLLRQRARLAATGEAAMCALFVLLVHVPGVLAEPSSHEQWTMLATAVEITAGAWAMRLTARYDGRPYAQAASAGWRA